MSTIDIVYLVVSLAIIAGISALMPWMAWQDYKYERARNESFRSTIDTDL